jgi:hypothetical protein
MQVLNCLDATCTGTQKKEGESGTAERRKENQ